MNNVVYAQKQNNWNMWDAYDAVNKEITQDWPEWKKKAYNDMFAVSAHAGKIEVDSNING